MKPEPLQLLCVYLSGPGPPDRKGWGLGFGLVPLVHEKGRQTRGRHLHLWVGVPGKTEGKCLLRIPGELRHDVH